MKALYVAVDGGAQEAVRPLAASAGAVLAGTSVEAARIDAFWSERLRAAGSDLLIVGTSDSAGGRAVESAARRAARAIGIPIAAIEDFSGNYFDVDGGEADVVFVESAAARIVLAERYCRQGALHIEVASPARYDAYRARLAELREGTQRAWARARAPAVLWAGQPETADSLATLEALMPVALEHGAEVLFKAHPRDPGYASGAYRKLLDPAGNRVRDVTDLTTPDALAAAPRLVATQFSSVAIEAGFYGIPALWILLPDAGGARLKQKKGYATPPLCMAGAAARAESQTALGHVFGQILRDDVYRETLIRCFDAYFQVDRSTVSELTARLSEIASE